MTMNRVIGSLGNLVIGLIDWTIDVQLNRALEQSNHSIEQFNYSITRLPNYQMRDNSLC